jgi:hypothetical protein
MSRNEKIAINDRERGLVNEYSVEQISDETNPDSSETKIK